MVRHILLKAGFAVSGDRGSRKEAEKFFHSGGLTAQQLKECREAENPQAQSDALHALGGKQALYLECASLAKRVRNSNGLQVPQEEREAEAVYLKSLERLETGYRKIQEQLVVGNLRLVAAVINKLQVYSMDWEDQFQHGAISLQKAVEYFDPSKGTKFSTYAVTVIRGDLLRALENFSTEVRIPSHVWAKMRQYHRVEKELCAILGREPSLMEIALELGITVQEAVQLQQYHLTSLSLDAPTGSEGEGVSLRDTLVDQNACIPGREWSAYHEWIAPFAEGLDFVERGVLRLYAGDGVSPRMNEAEIAQEMELSEETVLGAISTGLQKVLESRKGEEAA